MAHGGGSGHLSRCRHLAGHGHGFFAHGKGGPVSHSGWIQCHTEGDRGSCRRPDADRLA